MGEHGRGDRLGQEWVTMQPFHPVYEDLKMLDALSLVYATNGLATERREIELPLSPPIRMYRGARYRSFKTQADRDVWSQAWGRITELQDEGWRIARVTIDWGRTVPGLAGEREHWIGRMCPGAPMIVQTMSGLDKGRTVVELER